MNHCPWTGMKFCSACGAELPDHNPIGIVKEWKKKAELWDRHNCCGDWLKGTIREKKPRILTHYKKVVI